MKAYIPTTAQIEQFEVVEVTDTHLDLFKLEGIKYDVNRNIVLVRWDKFYRESEDAETYIKGAKTKRLMEATFNITL
jgi:hypothetical protein